MHIDMQVHMHVKSVIFIYIIHYVKQRDGRCFNEK